MQRASRIAKASRRAIPAAIERRYPDKFDDSALRMQRSVRTVNVAYLPMGMRISPSFMLNNFFNGVIL